MYRGAEHRPVSSADQHGIVGESDLLARLRLRIVVPDLNARKDDAPLLVRHILCGGGDDGSQQLPSLRAMRELLARRFALNIRELETVLRKQMATAAGAGATTARQRTAPSAPCATAACRAPTKGRVVLCSSAMCVTKVLLTSGDGGRATGRRSPASPRLT